MITFERACEIAIMHYEELAGIKGICQPYDIGDAWVFNGGNCDDELVGVQKVAVSKEDGSLRSFMLPNAKNFALLGAGVPLELPDRFQK